MRATWDTISDFAFPFWVAKVAGFSSIFHSPGRQKACSISGSNYYAKSLLLVLQVQEDLADHFALVDPGQAAGEHSSQGLVDCLGRGRQPQFLQGVKEVGVVGLRHLDRLRLPGQYAV